MLLINADSLKIPLASGSVHMVATSPPYWGLRDYGNPDQLGLEPLHDCLGWATGESCGLCYVCKMRAVFTEIWRVLRDDGVVWLNLGDSYASQGGHTSNGTSSQRNGRANVNEQNRGSYNSISGNLKPKDLCMIPARVALALQADGWYVRSDIVWAKLNPMPESVTDRPTKAHEYIFLLAKRERYFYDAEAVKEPMSPVSIDRMRYSFGGEKTYALLEADKIGPGVRTRVVGNRTPSPSGRNRRTVWAVATQPYSGAHFATWPPALVEPMIKAGTSERGCCPACGRQWERVVDRITGAARQRPGYTANCTMRNDGGRPGSYTGTTVVDYGWLPACDCNAGEPAPSIVLDPFAGSGTTGLVARQLGRRFVGLDISFNYLRDQARPRLALDKLEAMTNGSGIVDEADYADLPLFSI